MNELSGLNIFEYTIFIIFNFILLIPVYLLGKRIFENGKNKIDISLKFSALMVFFLFAFLIELGFIFWFTTGNSGYILLVVPLFLCLAFLALPIIIVSTLIQLKYSDKLREYLDKRITKNQ